MWRHLSPITVAGIKEKIESFERLSQSMGSAREGSGLVTVEQISI